MKNEKIILQKGESITFLDYKIKNCLNNDGLVLLKASGEDYETHLGNYGTGTQEHIDYCKVDAILYFMLARPHIFATTIVHKLRRVNSGTMHEYFVLKVQCEEESIPLPEEITCGDSLNRMIYYKGKPLQESALIALQKDKEDKDMIESITGGEIKQAN